jgi:protein-S-isoprenylcysteine O-methyltransferase Ste14
MVQSIDLGVARAVIAAASLALVVIPASLHRGVAMPVARSGKGLRERLHLASVSLGFLTALVWAATPLLGFADYSLHPARLAAGSALLLVGLWLLYRSHADLGPNWSMSLEMREGHRLVTRGLYRRIRHPMYLALLVYGAGQALVLPNWLAGPAYPIALALLVAARISPEERMMADSFGAKYEAYRKRTNRLLPGLW